MINATGVIVHTNLGRAPWPAAAIRAAASAAEGTLFLELDRETGRRGRRYREAEAHLIALTGAEDALIVVNNAAAVALAVGLAGRGGVAVSRGELVEIGGGVRIPEIVQRAGARLVEVGTTNRTRVADFEDGPRGRAGATRAPRPPVQLQPGRVRRGARCAGARGCRASPRRARRRRPRQRRPARHGRLRPRRTSRCRRNGSPTAPTSSPSAATSWSAARRRGSSSAGRTSWRACARTRSPARCGPTRSCWRRSRRRSRCTGRASRTREIPVWRQISAPVDRLEARARAIAAAVGGDATVSEVEATIGGGSLPGQTLPSRAVCVTAARPDALLSRLRAGSPAVVGRIERGAVVLDLRSVEPDDDAALASALRAALDHRD